MIRPAILWNDQRTAHACDEIREAMDPDADFESLPELIETVGGDR